MHKFVISEGKDRNPILLEGPTGSGKTFMFQLLEEMPELKDLCFFNYCASDMTPNGFSGDDISNVFSKYERMARQKMKKGENGLQMPLGIIFLDEMDKIIGMSNTDSNGEDCNAIVTAQLLTAIAGTQNYGSVDTSKILFIMAGAFEELENSRKKKREEHGIGFAVNASAKEKENSMTGYWKRSVFQSSFSEGCLTLYIWTGCQELSCVRFWWIRNMEYLVRNRSGSKETEKR